MTDTTPNPIETEYRGYRFRSRLEARWAVYFDTMEYTWEYEPEGFHLKSGDYLPDFRIDGESWWEVKPAMPGGQASRGFRDLDPRWVDLVATTGMELSVTFGLPGPGEWWPAVALLPGPAGTVLVRTDGRPGPTDLARRAALAAARGARFEHHGSDPTAQPRDARAPALFGDLVDDVAAALEPDHMQRAAGDR